MTLRQSLLAATVLAALPLTAQAQPVTGLYVSGSAGVNWLDSTTATGNLSTALGSVPVTQQTLNFSTGWVGLVDVGWGFGNGLRVEGEFNYRNNDVSSTRTPNLTLQGNGSVGQFGLMVNAVYDFNLGLPVVPYLGAGIGWGWSRYNNVNGRASDTAGNTLLLRVSGNDSQFAYQAFAGFAVPIAAVPGLAITAEYRFYATLDPNIQGQAVATDAKGAQTVRNYGVSPTNLNNSLLVGVRYNFGQTPPAPPPAVAAPAPARSYLVFFDFGSDQLTARARDIVGQAAQSARSQQVTRIEVAGHTDTVGSAQYNQGLSLRRANNVAAELVRLGVAREAIQTAGYGFSRPLVPTGPNVREPQNRRVEIVLR